MPSTYLPAIAATGFTVAFFHAAIPTHWLPFVLVGRAQGWNRSKTLLVTALAGAGHVLFTTVLGVLVVWLGIELNKKATDLFPRLAGGTLILFGFFYLFRQLTGRGHGHSHLFGGKHHHDAHSHSHDHAHDTSHGHGTHGGILVDTGHGFTEISVFETNVPPRFRLYFFDEQRHPIAVPLGQTVTLETIRPDTARQQFAFAEQGGFLEATTELPEPHEFRAVLTLAHGAHQHAQEVEFTEHDHQHECSAPPTGAEEAMAGQKPPPPTSDWVAISGLLALLTFSPCEGFLPVYLTGIKYGWPGFALLSLILALATLAGMVVFTWLTLVGLARVNLKFVEQYESGILGGLLCLLGLLVILFD